MKFLIQTVNGKVQHDFCFELEHAIEYQQWRGNDACCARYMSLEELQNGEVLPELKYHTPVGSIEFVFAFIDKYVKENGSSEIRPLNVPDELNAYNYTGRLIANIELNEKFDLEDLKQKLGYPKEHVFVKSNDRIKDPDNRFYGIIKFIQYY